MKKIKIENLQIFVSWKGGGVPLMWYYSLRYTLDCTNAFLSGMKYNFVVENLVFGSFSSEI